MPIEEITLRIRITPEFNELCDIHSQMSKLLEREAVLMDQIKTASMTGARLP